MDQLSKITIVTFTSASTVSSMLRASQNQRFAYGTASLTIRKQTVVYDRLCSAPIKCAMETLTRQNGQFRGHFQPDWRQGNLWTTAFGPSEVIATWVVDIEAATIRVNIKEEYVQAVEREMTSGLQRLNFGRDEQQEVEATKGRNSKGKGKGRKPNMPVEAESFKKEPAVYKDRLGALHLARFPFQVKVRTLQSQQAQAARQAHPQPAQRGSSKKRRSDERHRDGAAKRSNTPRRPPKVTLLCTGSGRSSTRSLGSLGGTFHSSRQCTIDKATQ